MPNLATVMKDEIRRLARKEIRAENATLKRLSAQHRRSIADLKRQIGELRREVARLERQGRPGRRAAAVAAAGETSAQPRFSPSWVASHRERLGLSAADYGALVGVSALTIYNWEKGKTRPRAAQLAAWGEVRALGKREALERLAENG